MEIGAITSGIDVALVVLYAFWIFFAGLIFYLRREDRREGYPLINDITGKPLDHGFIWVPEPKTFRLPHGGIETAPRAEHDTREIKAKPVAAFPGAPLQPTGDPMLDAVGPAAYALRSDKPELTLEGEPRMAPLRVATDFWIEPQDPDPRGMTVVAADGAVAGVVKDVWVDRAEPRISFLEVEVSGTTPRRALLPMTFARVDGGRRQVKVASVLARHFATVPALQNPDQITAREEDRISAYFASGHLYATPSRAEPLL
ncbi:MAG: photosynthetic reaction center subunit H [Rhodospirillales bacterium]|jgi:photosynthetic reaction center H subunit|nr:photosynthetic reaction center subunit H [Rhodospirillales bacterium]